MQQPIDFLLQLRSQLELSRHRVAVILDGSDEWRSELVGEYLSRTGIQKATKLGGDAYLKVELLSYRQGHQLLGGEREVLIFDDIEGFDANSFAASTGCLVGGGILFLLLDQEGASSIHWLRDAFSKLVCIKQGELVPLNFTHSNIQALPDYSDQKKAVEHIQHVLSGHRRRPLVITADRGRGKSSALGIASANMIQERPTRILVTAPARKSVDTLFEHAKRLLPDARVQKSSLIEYENSSLSFLSPDELLQTKPVCDILFVDEASAIPLPMLIDIVESYHRVVFSTTVHGYEGCGRGFTLKFSEWLTVHRPGWNSFELKTPIRWAKHDPLEQWLFDTFLLNAEVDGLPETILSDEQEPKLELISKKQLSRDRKLAQRSFALLVAAHYQTSPNDLIQVLEDESTNLINITVQGVLVGCMLVQFEGGMDKTLVSDVVSGKRRPKGHMIASTLATQLGVEKAAVQRCLRVMRIAIHPDAQRKGLGSKALARLSSLAELDFDYLSTSFGVTSDLYRFWLDAGFLPFRLGAKRDPASGTHSILMVQQNRKLDWFDSAAQQFSEQLISILPETFANTDSELMATILSGARKNMTYTESINYQLIYNYCFGAVSYESVFCDLYKAVCLSIISNDKKIPSIIISKILQRLSWRQVVSSFGLIGRKQGEQQLKNEIVLYLNLQCKAK